MNCAICSAYLAFKHGVKSKGIKMSYCIGCRPRKKNCAFLKKRCILLLNNKVQYCYECKTFPCMRLKRIDKRYSTFFKMSMIENLEFIKKSGIEKFLERETKKWKCPRCGDTVCCHNGICFNCGLHELRAKRNRYRWEES